MCEDLRQKQKLSGGPIGDVNRANSLQSATGHSE
jgi:hypothetical protein